jgi:hypothetical protein
MGTTGSLLTDNILLSVAVLVYLPLVTTAAHTTVSPLVPHSPAAVRRCRRSPRSASTGSSPSAAATRPPRPKAKQSKVMMPVMCLQENTVADPRIKYLVAIIHPALLPRLIFRN